MIYKVGDRVELKCSGGYTGFRAGMQGTVLNVIRGGGDECLATVAVDGKPDYRNGLSFFDYEIKPVGKDFVKMEFEDEDGDVTTVMRNSQADYNTDLYVRINDDTGAILKKEQAVKLAQAILNFYA